MTDSDLEFERQLGAWFRSEVTADVAAPASLRTSMAAIPATVSGQAGYRRWMLLAVATLALVATMSVVAIGSGLMRLPETRPDLIPLGGACVPELDESLILEAESELTPRIRRFVYRDGLVLISENRTEWPFNFWTRQRRLTTEGIDSLLAAATRPGLDDCRDVPLGDDSPDVGFAVRDGSSVNAFHLGYGRWSRADADAATMAAAAEMFRRVTDEDLGVPPDQWADAAWTAYVPDSYELTVTLPEGLDPLPDETWDRPLADGSTLQTIGQVIPGLGGRGTITRCAEMGAAEVGSLREYLAGVIRTPTSFSRGLNEAFFAALEVGGPGPGGSPWAEIRARSTLPHDPVCSDLLLGSGWDVPQNPDPDLMSLDVCGLLESAALPDGYSLPPAGEAWVSSDASGCTLRKVGPLLAGDGSPQEVYYSISLRVWPTSAADALRLARLAFGDGEYRIIELDRATAYRNCDACTPAIVISADPYLLLIEGPDAGDSDAENVLWALAEFAIQRLPD